MIKPSKYGQEYKASVACDLFRLPHHNFSSPFKTWHDYILFVKNFHQMKFVQDTAINFSSIDIKKIEIVS